MKQTNIYIKCENPVIIFNRGIIPILFESLHIVLFGQDYYLNHADISHLQNNHLIPALSYAKEKIRVNHDYINHCNVVSPDGILIPLFVLVPCRNCSLCNSIRCKEMETRNMLESQTSPTPPLAVLLTYNNSNLPSDGVSKEDIDLFLKRLRIKLNRDGFGNIRFFLVSEYGSKRGRPHYHAIFWNFPQFDSFKYLNYIKVRDYISSCWQNGFVSVRYVFDGHGNANYAAKYYTKYLYKPDTVKDGFNPTFMKCSRRHGIGYEWIMQNKDFYLNNPDCKTISIVDKWTGDSYTLSFPQYYKDILFPSISRIIPQKIRDYFYYFTCKFYSMKDQDFYRSLIEKYWFLVPTTFDFFGNISEFRLDKHNHSSYNAIDDDVITTLCNYFVPTNIDFIISYKFNRYSSYLFTLQHLAIPIPPANERYEVLQLLTNDIKLPQPSFSDEQ